MAEYAPTLLFSLAQLLAESPGINYYVDGTNGDDGNHGKDWAHAFQTIQKAIDEQIANSSGLGDVIYIAPGNYIESLTGDLTRVALIGVPGRYPWHIASIRPTDGYAYHGTLFEAMFKNLCFLSADTTHKTYPAVLLDNARYSIIEDCHFVGRDPSCVEGLQIGPTTDDATVAHLDYCIIRRNRFDTWYGTASEFTHAIKMGFVGGASPGAKFIFGTTIEDNIIYALTIGIYMLCGPPNGDFTIVRRNLIDSMAAEEGCATAGIQFSDGNFPAFADNWINATDAIIYPSGGTERKFFNRVTDAGTVAMELPVSA